MIICPHTHTSLSVDKKKPFYLERLDQPVNIPALRHVSNTFTCRPVNSRVSFQNQTTLQQVGRGNYEIVMLQANYITIFGARQQMNSELDAAELFKYGKCAWEEFYTRRLGLEVTRKLLTRKVGSGGDVCVQMPSIFRETSACTPSFLAVHFCNAVKLFACYLSPLLVTRKRIFEAH